MNHIQIRKIVHNSHCEYIGGFACPDILHFFRMYSGIWMGEHVDKDGILRNEDICDLIENVEEFNLLEEDYFIIGYPVTHSYEGIVSGCNSVFILQPDEYGFETAKDSQGNNLTYKHVKTHF